MTNDDKRFAVAPDVLRVAIVVLAVAIGTIVVVVTGASVWSVVSFVGKLVAIVVLGMIAWASWTGYFQNRGRNDEWPLNVAFFFLSVIGVVGLIATMVSR